MWFFHKSRFKKLIDIKSAEDRFAEVRPEMEKSDLPAIIIAAIIIFAPFVLVLTGVLLLLSWLIGR